jgi:hypothetical protein
MERYFLILAVVLITLSCQGQQKLHEVEWLIGNWSRIDEKPGRTGFEQWHKVSDAELNGNGASLKGTDTLFVEKIRIILKDGSLYYVADVPENNTPVFFKFTAVTPTSFVCENAGHDFPKMIAYSLEGDKLKASISGDGKQIDYFFRRMD